MSKNEGATNSLEQPKNKYEQAISAVATLGEISEYIKSLLDNAGENVPEEARNSLKEQVALVKRSENPEMTVKDFMTDLVPHIITVYGLQEKVKRLWIEGKIDQEDTLEGFEGLFLDMDTYGAELKSTGGEDVPRDQVLDVLEKIKKNPLDLQLDLLINKTVPSMYGLKDRFHNLIQTPQSSTT